MPNDLLAELAQLDHIAGVKQANPENLAPIDGLQIYAGDDETAGDVLEMGEPGGILTGSHVFGARDAQDGRRARAPPRDRRRAQDTYGTWGSRRGVHGQGGAQPDRIAVGVPRLPYVELDPAETELIRAMLERHGLLQTARA